VSDERRVHLVLPAGYDDPRRASGGNSYDRQVSSGLTDLGWTVVSHEVPQAWPVPDAAVAGTLDRELALIPDDQVVVIDGLLATPAREALLRNATRLRLAALVHMPGPPGGPPGDVLRAARLVIATSQATGQTLAREHDLPPRDVLVAPPGVASAELATGTTSGSALLCVAAVTEPKGHDVLFAALAGLAGRAGIASHGWTCTCVGDLDRDPAFVDQQRHRLADGGVADRVRLTGPLVGADLDRAYAAADVLVLASRHEGYGMVVTEALARGLPVIATSVGGVPEAVGHAADGRRPALLVPPGDDQALGRAIASWLADPDLRAELQDAARSRRASLGGWRETFATISAAITELAAA
jgi:glycosyltransferase involved in cell wall biosynthesis